MIRGKFLTSKDDISQIIAMRREIFVEELGFPAEYEPDEHDNMAVYALAYADDGTPIASGRLYIENDRFTIGRVCVIKPLRRMQIGDFIMRMLLYRAQELNAGSVSLECEVDNMHFYTRYGFKPQGEVIDICGRAGRRMCVSGEDINIEGSCHCQKKCDGCTGDCGECSNG